MNGLGDQGYKELTKLPPELRKLVLPFLTLKEIGRLDTAVAPGTEGERDDLLNAYVGLRCAGFDAHVYITEKEFKGIGWALKRGINLLRLNLEYKGEKDPDKVLHLLVADEREDIASYYAERSEAKSIMGGRISLTPNDSFFSTLSRASRHGYLVVVQCLIGRGADVNESFDDENVGYTPLHGASWYGHLDVVKALLATGADVGARDNEINTPLHYASKYGHLEVVSALLAAGADVNARNDIGYTPLHWASSRGYFEVVRALLAAGADVGARENLYLGNTSLHYASWYGHLDVVRALLAAGADVNARNDNGDTPLHEASLEVKEILNDHGCSRHRQQ